MFFKKPTFIKSYLAVIPYIDPDSPRFVDWIFGERMIHGLNTHTRHSRLNNDNGRWSMDEALAILPDEAKLLELFPEATNMKLHRYTSNGFHRVYGVERIKEGMFSYREVLRYVCVVGVADGELTYVAVGEKVFVDFVNNIAADTFKVPASITVRTLLGFSQQGPIVDERILRDSDAEQFMGHYTFYPCIHEDYEDIDDLANQFNQSRDSILIFIGPPGTGKSTLIRTLMFKMGRDKVNSINSEVVLQNPEVMPWIQGLGDNSLLMIEDADNMCRPRKDGNHQMSALLNHAEGIVRNNCKIIISTNLESLRDVDAALIRDGRAFNVITFTTLTPIEANRARVSIGLEAIPDGELRDKYTLAEALNFKVGKKTHKTTTIGFVR